jgi:hypothetical protein
MHATAPTPPRKSLPERRLGVGRATLYLRIRDLQLDVDREETELGE